MYVSIKFGNFGVYYHNPHDDEKQLKQTYSNRPEVHCSIKDISGSSSLPLKTPSLESLIRASSTMEKPELRLSGLAVFSKLSNACQPLVDVSKSNIQVNKIALITVMEKIGKGWSQTAPFLFQEVGGGGRGVGGRSR